MTGQHRDLVPLTVYVPIAAREEAERRASKLSVATGTLLRMILLGQQKPLADPTSEE